MLRSFHFIFIFIVIFSITSCEDCDDCGPLQKEPSLTLKFINQDSLSSIQDSLLIINTSIADLNSMLDSINIELGILNDSLRNIEVLIAGGDESFEVEKSLIESRIDELQTTFDEIQNSRLIEEEKIINLEVIATDIENGKMRIDSLLSKTDQTTLIFEPDSLESFKFPLSVNLDSTSYQVFIGQNSYDLAVEYVRNFNEDEKSRIEMVISRIRIKNHTFNEAINSCEECLSNETSITVFF